MRVFAIHAHPDDIEFTTAGTLMLLKEYADCEIHYLTLANGSCGSSTMNREETIRTRREEGMNAARYLGATYHESLFDDLQVFYTPENMARVCAVIRKVKPDIILTASPYDYMEDHIQTSKLVSMAAFSRCMNNFPTIPAVKAFFEDIYVYHAAPHGLHNAMRREIYSDLYVNVSSVIDQKKEALACHKSQKEWLDQTQGFGNYIHSMVEMNHQLGKQCQQLDLAEGWTRHSHLGYSQQDNDPLFELLQGFITTP